MEKMKIVIFVIFTIATFHSGHAFTKGLMNYFDQLFEEIFYDEDSSDDDMYGFLSDFYDYDDTTEEDYDRPVQLPSGPSWLQTMHLIPPQTSTGDNNRPIGGQLKPPENVNNGETPQSTIQTEIPSSQQELSNAKPIPIAPPGILTPVASNSTNSSSDSLILSLAQDMVDDTDGEGVLVGE